MSPVIRSLLVDKKELLEKSPFPLFVEIRSVVKPYPLHHHNFSEITVILHGEAEHQIGDLTCQAAVGDVFLFVGDKHHCFTKARDLKVINVQFAPELLGAALAELRREPGFRAFFELEPKARRSHGFRSRLTLLPAQLQYVASICEDMERETRERHVGFAFLTRIAFIHLCGYLGRCYSKLPGVKAQSLNRIGKALNRIEQCYYERITVPDLASLTNMSESAFLRNFKEAMHRSPVDYLIQYRIEKACQRLAGTEESVTDVALEVGFNSVEYFSRKFRELMRCAPRDYRLKNREEGRTVTASIAGKGPR